jgi:hypothetical protein
MIDSPAMHHVWSKCKTFTSPCRRFSIFVPYSDLAWQSKVAVVAKRSDFAQGDAVIGARGLAKPGFHFLLLAPPMIVPS